MSVTALKRVRKKAEAARRFKKLPRKQAQREGLLPAPKKELPARGRSVPGTGTAG